jgi:gluconate 2-dehydrogenase gamma chain
VSTAWIDEAARSVREQRHELHRRELLELIAIVAMLPACKGSDKPAPAPTGSASGAVAPPRPATALDPATYRTIDAATARILPADGDFPGAGEARVIDFIDRQLAIAPLSRVAPAIVAVARALDDAARARRAAEYATLPALAQDEILDALSRGALGTKLPEAELFRILHGLVLEGFLADPHHGGNKDSIAWKAIGFTEPTLRVKGGSHGGHGSAG